MAVITTAALAAHAAERLADIRQRAARHHAAAAADPATGLLKSQLIGALAEQIDRQREIALLAHTHGDPAVAEQIGADINAASDELGRLAHECRLVAVARSTGSPA